MKPPRARFNDGQQRTPRILNVEVQQNLTRAMQRIGSLILVRSSSASLASQTENSVGVS
jgi:hypothetical protein